MMLTFHDMTFCPFWETCADGQGCFRALTDQVRAAADKAGLGTAKYADKPDCYREDIEGGRE